MVWTAKILTLYPDMFPGPLGFGVTGQGLMQGLWQVEAVDIRRFSRDKHASVDDTPAGGGPGMVMRPDVLAAAIDATAPPNWPRILFSPRGAPLTQARVRDIAGGPGVVMVCGRFEGVDERVITARQLEEVSLGDYVLSGGEFGAMVLADAVARLIPGVLGAHASPQDESFENGLLEYPHYTRPRDWEGQKIPEVLLSGHHEHIRTWRQERAEEITQRRRPDLWSRYRQRNADTAAPKGRRATTKE